MTRHRKHDIMRTQQAPKGLPRVFMFLAALLALNAGCVRDRDVVYADFVDIPSEGWSRKEFCAFETAKVDSAMLADPDARYDVMLTVRHTGECPYTELFLPAVQSQDRCTSLPDTLHVSLVDPDGTWRGTHSKGIYSLTDTLLRHTSLPPLYSLRLYHAMPVERLAGLLSVGITVERTHQP